MKTTLFFIGLIICINANAAHRVTYFVYFETEYIQGPWSKTNILKTSNYKYLAPQPFEDLLGTEDAELVLKMLSRLEEHNPERYNWQFELIIQHDTVILTVNDQINDFESVKNEVTTTLTLNGFKAVTFHIENIGSTYTLADISLPYFDLVKAGKKKIKPKPVKQPQGSVNDNKSTPGQKAAIQQPVEPEGNTLTIWLIVSVIINFLLISLLLMRNKQA